MYLPPATSSERALPMPSPLNCGKVMPCSVAASAIALNQPFCRGFSTIFLIRWVIGKLHVFHRAGDQVLVFICSTFEQLILVQSFNSHAKYPDLAAQPGIIAASGCRSFSDRAIRGPACVSGFSVPGNVPVTPVATNTFRTRRVNLAVEFDVQHFRGFGRHSPIEPDLVF
jgi:hypothetical protein